LKNINGSCKYCGRERISKKASERQIGENNHSWQGGITSLCEYLRNNIINWKKDSMKNCNYKCVITGEKFNVIHHLYSFNKISKEVLEETNLPIYKEINKYSDEQLEQLKKVNLELHYKYGLGICLSKKIHDLYHSLYGDNNTPQQFEEFVQRYYNGEFEEANNASFLFNNKEVAFI